MANRVTGDEVKEILDTVKTAAQILPFINAANSLVTALLGNDTTLSAAQLAEIEKWLAAHFVACTIDQQAQSEGAADADITYQGKTDKGLDATFYGQQVKLLDTTGIIAKNVGKRKASIYAITSFS